MTFSEYLNFTINIYGTNLQMYSNLFWPFATNSFTNFIQRPRESVIANLDFVCPWLMSTTHIVSKWSSALKTMKIKSGSSLFTTKMPYTTRTLFKLWSLQFTRYSLKSFWYSSERTKQFSPLCILTQIWISRLSGRKEVLRLIISENQVQFSKQFVTNLKNFH